jgi:hypothetical protein
MTEPTWRVLVERYAIQAREFSDAVASLGHANLPPSKCGELFEVTKARLESCLAAADAVQQYIKQNADAVDGS